MRALRVAQAVARFGGPVSGVDWERRRLLQQGGALAGLALLGEWTRLLRGLAFPAAPSAPASEREGEVWEGFLLLPPGAPLPLWVQRVPAPILCQTADPEAEAELRGETVPMEPWGVWASRIPFSLYAPTSLPPGFVFQGAYATVFRRSGAIFSVSLAFGEAGGEPVVRLIAQPIHPSPYPVWPVYRPDRPEEPIPPEKVFFLPRPGVLLPSARGHLMLWQEQGVLYYILIAEHDPRREAAIALTRSRERIHL